MEGLYADGAPNDSKLTGNEIENLLGLNAQKLLNI